MPADDLGALVALETVQTMDFTFAQLDERLGGLTDAEFRWEPVAGSWNVHRSGETRATVDFVKPDPVPAPMTTIAWRTWHLAVDCFDGYSRRAFGTSGTGLDGTQWTLEADVACELLQRAYSTFRDGVVASELDVLFAPLGPTWGPYAESTRFALALHALHELAHHGAEIGLLRDLYARRTELQP
jgi:hypothetical protein